MTKVYQTKFVKEHGIGNCLQAALASLLDLSLDSVPEFIGGPDEKWFIEMQDFIWGKGYSLVEGDIKTSEDYMLVVGGSPRGEYKHAVIYRNGELVHDPHPDGTSVEQVDFAASVIKNTP